VSEGVSPQFMYQQRLTYEVELLRALHGVYSAMLKLNVSVRGDKQGAAYVTLLNALRGLYVLLTRELREEVSRRMGGDVLEATEYVTVLLGEESESPLPVRRGDLERASKEVLEELRKECERDCKKRGGGSECVGSCVEAEIEDGEVDGDIAVRAFGYSKSYWDRYCNEFVMTVVDVLKEHGLLLRESELFRGVVGEESQ